LKKNTSIPRFVCCLSLAVVCSAAYAQARSAKAIDEMWDATLRQSDKLMEIGNDFAAAHPFKGKAAQAAVDQLRSEGFRCAIEYRRLPFLQKGTIDKFAFETVPLIYCSRPHQSTGADDLCKTFWAGFQINWEDPKRSPEQLWKEAAKSSIKDEFYFCRTAFEP
jgi:hypothetical protein